jgi:acyl-CoA thioester hydrolase
MSTTNPPIIHHETVISDWVDYNGHMNVAYYVLVFDHATDVFLDSIGMNHELRNATGSSVFVAEAHVTYDDEVMEGDIVEISSQVIGIDDKRLHLFHRMYRKSDGALAATNELMILHVNLNTRRVGPFPDPIMLQLKDISARHGEFPRPDKLGRVMGIPHKLK